MARFDDIGSGSLNNFGQLLGDVAINTFDRMVRGMVFEMLSAHVNDFNLMNYDYMRFHMFRNAYEKEITLNSLGENAYREGNSDDTATPALEPTYVQGNNYMEFVTNTREGEKKGQLTTRLQKAGKENTNYYLDMDNGDSQVEFTGSILDRNSILYKTKRLMRQHKLKTIISQFHTDPSVEYNGQVGSEYGESHGRNLLTKNAENHGVEVGEYDNPYCRVWTHHYKYDKIEKTMRAYGDEMYVWDNFEWNKTDKGHNEDESSYGDGEKYDYAWKGKHNQDRRKAHSVLDGNTGLVKMTPQYRGGGEKNRHTKDCMFSIENLAWKDYDPYSFEQALSWEQRGPLGGRIMWFPPYGIEVNETATAKWQPNEFIGRGEPVYTYINSERSGNLSFLMITDHPSSIDYASWWDNNNMIKNATDTSGNSETDYLRYFAGCSEENSDGKTGGLIIKPTPMTDEYTRENPPLIAGVRRFKTNLPEIEIVATPPIEDKNPEYVEFFVFFPNNYSGVNDMPFNTSTSSVEALSYLLGGRNASKEENGADYAFSLSNFSLYSDMADTFLGYEMNSDGITTNDCIEKKEYIQGGIYLPKKEPKYNYTAKAERKWCYRIDHKQPYVGGKQDGTNLICEILKVDTNYKDSKTYKTNLDVSNNTRVQEMAQHKENLYSFAEVFAAINSNKIVGVEESPILTGLSQYLNNCGINTERVNKLIELFSNKDQFLTSVVCDGIASSHGHAEENALLSKNRANTVLRWIQGITGLNKKDGITYSIGNHQTKTVDDADKKNVNGESAKLYRCAHCVMTFESGTTQLTQPVDTQNNETVEEPKANEPEHIDYVGFDWVKSEVKTDGHVWNYYKKNGEITYFDQIHGSSDNYDNPDKNDVVVDKNQILQIFKDYPPQKIEVVKNNPKYRGVYNEYGVFLNNYDYSSQPEDLRIHEFVNGQENRFRVGEHLYHAGSFYAVNENFNATTWDDILIEMYLTDVTSHIEYYSIDDIVSHEDQGVITYYTCKNNYTESHPDYNFNSSEWEEVTPANINDAIVEPYVYKEESDKPYWEKEIIYWSEPGVFKMVTRKFLITPPGGDLDKWELLWVDCYESGEPGDEWDTGDYVTYNDVLYCAAHDNIQYTGEFDENDWNRVETVTFSDLENEFEVGEIVEYNDEFYEVKEHIDRYVWTDDLRPAIPSLVCNSENQLGEFDGEYPYAIGDYCRHENKYYKSLVDFSEKDRALIPFDNSETGDWEVITDDKLNSYVYSLEQSSLITKSAAVLCYTVDRMISEVTGSASVTFDEDTTYDCIWKYGTTNNLVTPQTITTATNLYSHAQSLEPDSRSTSAAQNAAIKFSKDEDNFLEVLISQGQVTTTIEELRTLIILYRILDGITKINDTEGTRNVCDSAVENNEEMKEKTQRIDESETEGCEDSLWVDRGDRLLIQECNLPNDGDELINSRFNPETGEGEWNKLRYDQEYHFYKQWIADHPLMYEKLQEKIKYFNPAFHSMTPEGFNARCTFLQQCTRQGNTKTMSDKGGKTANNLAFGRAPYCVLRLGDFYNQMIVIDNISFDYNVDDGIQWDLNPEGNGVQPMLCKVNISFKFIGGGDITGPVQRLQNAMSFNYYANASFYDNRADRTEYQPTNWKTMGGAGNNEVDLDKSYAFIAQNYEKLKKSDKNITVPGW